MEYILVILFFLIIGCSFGVILSNTPIQSILFLILVFIFTIFFFVILGAEFLAIAILIIYVGAILILFLFVIMLLNLRIVEIYSKIYYYLPIGSFLGLLFIVSLSIIILQIFGIPFYLNSFYLIELINNFYLNSNLFCLGELLFNYNSDLFIIGSFILLVAMIGSIILVFESAFKSK